jgi:hypothetical protein
MKTPSFWQVALRPRWIGAFFLSLLIAAGLGSLAQWQLERSYIAPETTTSKIDGELKHLMLDQTQVYLVSDRIQNGKPGYWLIANAKDKAGTSFTVALAWAENISTAESARTELMNSMQAQAFLPAKLFRIDSEAPVVLADKSKPYLLGSLSMAQLINLYSPDQPIKADPHAWVAGSEQAGGQLFMWAGLEPIELAYTDPGAINWLTAFYALEWTLFAGFAVFLWWRLVRDTQIREQSGPNGDAEPKVN